MLGRETQEGNFDSHQELPHLVSLPRADHRPGEQTSAAGTQEISCGLTSSVPFILRGWSTEPDMWKRRRQSGLCAVFGKARGVGFFLSREVGKVEALGEKVDMQVLVRSIC